MTSLWHETATLPRFPALNRDAACDVLVIGGGMAGLLTLYELRRRGLYFVKQYQMRSFVVALKNAPALRDRK